MGAVIGDRDLSRFRQEYYALTSLLFLRQPTEEALKLLATGSDERAEGAVHLNQELARGWKAIGRALKELAENPAATLEKAVEEYNELFGGLVPPLTPCESLYLTGKLFGTPLAAIRNLMNRIGLEKSPEYPEPEDHIGFLAEIMRQLILRQEAAKDPDEETKWLNYQGDLLKGHLSRWVPRFCDDLEKAERADLYAGVAKLLRGLMHLEAELLAEWGSAQPEHILQIKVKEKDFTGPLFDPAQFEAQGLQEKGPPEPPEKTP
ncbi:MAG: molecular chaperone [Candidatus Methylomirabilales bacterium]